MTQFLREQLKKTSCSQAKQTNKIYKESKFVVFMFVISLFILGVG